MSTLLEQWREIPLTRKRWIKLLCRSSGEPISRLKEIYEKLLENPDEEVKRNCKGLAEKYGINLIYNDRFPDGINDSLKVANQLKQWIGDTEVSLLLIKNCFTRTW